MKLYQNIPLGYALTIEADGVTSGIYVQKQAGSIYTPGTFAASSTTVIGPFNDARDYEIEYNGNTPQLSCVQSGIFTKADEDGLYQPSAETNIAEIANDADGTAIATAVNSILDILIANGLMAAPEE